MGYSTQFTGQLGFAEEPTAGQLAALKEMFGEDCRDHKDWAPTGDSVYIDLELTEDFAGVRWSGAEKTYGLQDAVNVVTRQMRKRWPSFRFTGSLNAQGEDLEDRWQLFVDDAGTAHKRMVAIEGRVLECPDCGHRFVLKA